MMDLRVLAKYPFLEDAKRFVKASGFSMGEVLDDPLYERARLIGIERLENSLKYRDVGSRGVSSENDCVMELLSYPISRMIAVCVGDSYFKRRYALSEAVRAYKNLRKEDIDFVILVAKEFGFDLKYDEERDILGVHFTDYVHNAPTRYKKWKMVNRDLHNGYVRIRHNDLVRLIQEALRRRINLELDEKECNEKIYRKFYFDIKRFQKQVYSFRKTVAAQPIGRLDMDKLPPCMKEILGAVQAGENVPHMGRFALVAFLNSLKLGANEILKIFSSAPDFEVEKTRYQIEHITGDKSSTSYASPSCDKMRTYGICPVDKTDDLCKKVNHPLGYYRAKWRESSKKKAHEEVRSG